MTITLLLMFIWFKRVYKINNLKNESNTTDCFLHEWFFYRPFKLLFTPFTFCRVLYRIKTGCHNIFISLLNILVEGIKKVGLIGVFGGMAEGQSSFTSCRTLAQIVSLKTLKMEIFHVHNETYSKMWIHIKIGRDTLSNL